MEITLKNEQAQFEALQKRCLDITEQCKKLVITDDTTMKIAIQNLSLLKSEMKIVVEVHKIAKEPYLKPCQALDKLKNALHDPMETVYNIKNKEILAFDKLEREKAAAETKRINDIKTAITTYSSDCIAAMNACVTMDELRDVRTKWIVNAPLDKWGEFVKDFENTRFTLNELSKSLRTKLTNPEQSDPEEAVAIAEVVAQEVSSIGVQEVAATFVPKLSGSRKTWTHEVVDFNQIPRDWLVLNEAKVKEYISANKESFTDGCIVKGIKYYQKESLTIR